MSNKFGLFINMDYANKPKDECFIIWEVISDVMLKNNFSFNKRVFVFETEKNSHELSETVRKLFDDIHKEHPDLYSYIADCYILNFDGCNNLLLPDTSNTIEVEHISIDEISGFERFSFKEDNIT